MPRNQVVDNFAHLAAEVKVNVVLEQGYVLILRRRTSKGGAKEAFGG
jgi:hypothetical protein